MLCVFCNPPNLTFAIERMIWRYFAEKTATIWLQDKGGGGLVFQDRYRLDRLALTKKFSQWRKYEVFFR